MSIVIPVRGSTSTVEIFNDELPDVSTDVINLLRAELAPLRTWCEFAVAYHNQGREEQFREVLLGVVEAFDVYEMQDFYRREPGVFEAGRLRVLNLLAASATNNFIRELRTDAREAWRQKVLEYIGRADKISDASPQTWLIKSIFWISEYHRDARALENATYYADSLLRNSNEISCSARLVKAAILYHEKKYADALQLYTRALRSDPRAAGSSVRIGIGLCAYHLGDTNTALAALERAVALSPRCVPALVATAFLRLIRASELGIGENSIKKSAVLQDPHQSRQGVWNEATPLLIRARDLNPAYSVALNHHANYMFWEHQEALFVGYAQSNVACILSYTDPRALLKSDAHIRVAFEQNNKQALETRVLKITLEPGSKNWWRVKLSSTLPLLSKNEVHKVAIRIIRTPEIEKLASRAYHCTTVPEIQAEAYFILGRSHHGSGNMKVAMPYYTQACKLSPSFALAQYRLAQVQAALGDLPMALEAAETALALAPHAPEVLQLAGILRLESHAFHTSHEVLSLAVAADADNHLTWLALAMSLERRVIMGSRDPAVIARVVDAYCTAAGLRRDRGIPVPYQVSNNTGVLQFELHNIVSSQAAFLAALRDCSRRAHFIGEVHYEDMELDPNVLLAVGLAKSPRENARSCQIWKCVDGEAWLDSVDCCKLWTTGHTVLALRIGERIRIGNGDDACIVRVRGICALEITDEMKNTRDLSTLHSCGQSFSIALSEPLRCYSGAKMQSIKIYHIQALEQHCTDKAIASVYANLAQLHVAAGDVITAGELATNAIQIVPTNIRGMLLGARLALITRNLDQCRIYLDEVNSLAFDHLQKLNNTASSGLFEGSNRAHIVDALVFSGGIWVELKEFGKARSLLGDSQRLCEDNEDKFLSPLYSNVAISKLHLFTNPHGIELAVDRALAALKACASCDVAARALGVVLMGFCQLDDAAHIFERLQDGVTTRTVDARINLGNFNCTRGRWLEAATEYTASTNSTPTTQDSTQNSRADLQYLLSRAYFGVNDVKASRWTLTAAVHLNPNSLSFRRHCH